MTVTLGKTEDVRTDQNLADITVGDPDVADVNPLTDHALSILGKKIGTTRVTVYGPDKKPVGIFDVEVSYDISRLATEIARFTGGGIKVSSVNGRIMLSGTSPDAVTLDKAVEIARQFGPDPINTVQVMQPQQIMLEVRFIEANRQASRELGVQWNMFGNSALANVGSGLPASQLPITQPGGAFQQPAHRRQRPRRRQRRCRPRCRFRRSSPPACCPARRRSAFWSANCRTGSRSRSTRSRQKGAARSLAEPNLVALSGDTASFLAGGEFPVPVPGTLGTVTIDYKKYGVGLAFTPTVLNGGLINLKIEPEVSQLDTSHPVHGRRHFGAAADRAPRLDHARTARRPELHARRPVAEHQHQRRQDQLPWLGDVPVLGALFRSTAISEERDRSRDPGDAASGAPDGAERSDPHAARQHACRRTTSICS